MDRISIIEIPVSMKFPSRPMHRATHANLEVSNVETRIPPSLDTEPLISFMSKKDQS